MRFVSLHEFKLPVSLCYVQVFECLVKSRRFLEFVHMEFQKIRETTSFYLRMVSVSYLVICSFVSIFCHCLNHNCLTILDELHCVLL